MFKYFKTWIVKKNNDPLWFNANISLKKYFVELLNSFEGYFKYELKTVNVDGSVERNSYMLAQDIVLDEEENRDELSTLTGRTKGYVTNYRLCGETKTIDYFALAFSEFCNLNSKLSTEVRKKRILILRHDEDKYEVELFKSCSSEDYPLLNYKGFEYVKASDEKDDFYACTPCVNLLFLSARRGYTVFFGSLNTLKRTFNKLLETIKLKDCYNIVPIELLLSIIENSTNENLLEDFSENQKKVFISNLSFGTLNSKAIKKMRKFFVTPMLENTREILKATSLNLMKKLDYPKFTFVYNDIKYVYEDGQVKREDGQSLTICQNCGAITEQFYEDPDRNILCLDCMKRKYANRFSQVRHYHSDTVIRPMSPCGDKPSEKTLYGLELEGKYRDATTFQENWLNKIMPLLFKGKNKGKVERDGSVCGGDETITQPLNKEYLLGDEFKQFFTTWSELYKTDRDCGLHIHVNKDCLSETQWMKLLKIVKERYNDFLNSSLWRRTNYYCNLNTISNAVESWDCFASECDHYSAVSVSRHTSKTVEFRFFDGTDNYERFIKNIKTIMLLLDNIDILYDSLSEKIRIEA